MSSARTSVPHRSRTFVPSDLSVTYLQLPTPLFVNCLDENEDDDTGELFKTRIICRETHEITNHAECWEQVADLHEGICLATSILFVSRASVFSLNLEALNVNGRPDLACNSSTVNQSMKNLEIHDETSVSTTKLIIQRFRRFRLDPSEMNQKFQKFLELSKNEVEIRPNSASNSSLRNNMSKRNLTSEKVVAYINVHLRNEFCVGHCHGNSHSGVSRDDSRARESRNESRDCGDSRQETSTYVDSQNDLCVEVDCERDDEISSMFLLMM